MTQEISLRVNLTTFQKKALIRWVAEGLETDEINERAARYDPPFEVKRSLVNYYRKTRRVDLAAITKRQEHEALSTGLALKSVRVEKLKRLAALHEQDLFGGLLWLDQAKSIGGGDYQQVIEYEEYNAPQVKEYRGLLDDIAQEMGERRKGIEVTGQGGGPIKITEVVVKLGKVGVDEPLGD